MFRPNWPSSGVQVAVVKDSAAHCNAVLFPPIVTVFASGYFGYVVYPQRTTMMAEQHTTELPPQQQQSRQPQPTNQRNLKATMFNPHNQNKQRQ
jgi:hypothetical protein